MAPNFAPLKQELETRVLARTGRRLRNLGIELFPERVVLRGTGPPFPRLRPSPISSIVRGWK